MPEAVVLPDSASQVSAAVRIARATAYRSRPRRRPGLSGGAIPCEGGVVIVTTRMNRILDVDAENRFALVEPGVVNLDISGPSLRAACTTRPILPARKLHHRR